MDMKKILQALDEASTKPVEGSSDMAKFLRVVSEADINQPTAPSPATGSTLPPEQLEYNKLRAQLDGLDFLRGDTGRNTYVSSDPQVDANVNAMRQKLAQLEASLKAKGIDAKADYDAPEPGQQPAQPVDLATKYNSKDKAPQPVTEGANPHKVALPVQMAMQHYQQPTKKIVARESLIKKYFVEAEEEIKQKQEHRQQLIRQYASVIAERVRIKESKSPAIDQTAKRLTDPKDGAVAKLRAKGDKKREDQLKSRDIAKKGDLQEAPIDVTGDPNDPMIYGHQKANPMSLKGRIQQARAQLRELAQAAESNDLAVWQDICAKAKGGMFMGLEQNLEQIRHGIHELAAKRKKGGIASRGIDKNIGEGTEK